MAKPLVFKTKKSKRKQLHLPFPVDFEKSECNKNNFEGTFNENCVVVTEKDAISALYFQVNSLVYMLYITEFCSLNFCIIQGYFGKGNLSRSEPTLVPVNR